MAELKPCPFCGGSAYGHIKRMIHCNKDRYVVKCTKCNAYMEYRNKQSAITAWNRRTPQKIEHNSLCETETYKVEDK